MNNPENISIMKDHYQELYFKETVKNEKLLAQNKELKDRIYRLLNIIEEIKKIIDS